MTVPGRLATLRSRICAAAVLLTALAACVEDPYLDVTLSEAARRGGAVYRDLCSSCHHPDPHREGIQGPAVAGASSELLSAKVLHGVYPDGYTPKRTTGVMPVQPPLGERIDDLAAFLREMPAPPAR